MRRSAQVAAPILASTALALLTSCRKPEMQRCVDRSNRVVADDLCVADREEQPATGEASQFRYYYGGQLDTAKMSVTDGSNTPLPGHHYATSTTRGGFGDTFGTFLLLAAIAGPAVAVGVGG